MNRKPGFTLLEVAASLVIVGLALVAVLGMFSIGSRGNVINRERVIACNLLQRKLEEMKCIDFSTDIAESGTSYWGFSDYTFNVTQTTPYSGNSYLKMVNVSISWSSPYGSGSNTESASTLVANY